MKAVGTGRRYQRPGAVCSVVKLHFTRTMTMDNDGVSIGDIVIIISRLDSDMRLCLTSVGKLEGFWAEELQSQLFK